MKKFCIGLGIVLLVAVIGMFASDQPANNVVPADNNYIIENNVSNEIEQEVNEQNTINEQNEIQDNPEVPQEKEENKKQEDKKTTPTISSNNISSITSSIPEYSNSAYYVVNNNVPYFTASDLTTSSYEKYSDLDSLGRCGVAVACVGKDIMPTESRGDIGSVKPTGWHTAKYNGIDGNYLYNRCHLIGFQLTGENANTKNLITGTRYLNVQGMLPFENMVADYVKETNNHVLYRITPVFKGNNLLASGVLMEAKSVEDNGKGIEFNVYCYNVQPGIEIDYSNGESSGPEFTGSTSSSSSTKTTETKPSTTTTEKSTSTPASTETKPSTSTQKETTSTPTPPPVVVPSNTSSETSRTYVLNTNTKKFHYSSCSSAKQISDKNRQEFTGTRSEVISRGYEPCKKCNP